MLVEILSRVTIHLNKLSCVVFELVSIAANLLTACKHKRWLLSAWHGQCADEHLVRRTACQSASKSLSQDSVCLTFIKSDVRRVNKRTCWAAFRMLCVAQSFHMLNSFTGYQNRLGALRVPCHVFTSVPQAIPLY